MSTPRIGVTGMWSNRVHGLRLDGNAVATQVLSSVVAAGGEPLTLFAESRLSPAERLRGLDGLLIPGGADVQPARYGEAPAPETQVADFAGQDDFEAEMIEAALAAGLPVLAICRGFQLLNVLHGGSLDQHLGDESNPHRNSVHPVSIAPGSALAGVLGAEQIEVSSYHHQAVARVGEGLTVAATAPDGIVEALEKPGAELLAMQWHPEDTAAENPQQAALFGWLIERAEAYSAAGELAVV
ncbi:gamma-glutamyl-gamma-aminobutyrate hydrolase family protein [Leucobacter sp. M11]|uniref:gamma-glutamyl-gamma-aminobutyrate hydrolase family protein n=1 Tax=Leucobacter sp. M11 TaxID=2993565 RepID=UPI002D7F12D9|nr:gamma-glutamyl-gamma-aminobutyrate hydrolase family protein [Leucobacter sp. M11]MEB4614739.1 gamma-glutamyl-gamma-aminobutyrate hydrolase family protein [Leucobacter sp. M11]